MSESKWTPGPWFVIKAGGLNEFSIARRNQDDWNSSAGDCPMASIHGGYMHWENKYPQKANAHLIAAAPDLYEALTALLDAFEAFQREANWAKSAFSGKTISAVNCAPGIARTALAKARGEAS